MVCKFFYYSRLLIIFLSVSACTNSSNVVSKKITANWQFKSVKDTIWKPAKVPGTVHTDLLNNGIIEDPFYRLNEHDLQWIDKKDWEYKTSFNVEKSLFEKEKIELDFGGLDTYANIYVNNILVLKTENMFVSYKIDCKPYLKQGENQLKIIFDSPIKIGLKKREALGYGLPNAVNDQSENGGLGKKQVAVFSRKPGYHFGWDWGPRLVSSGIWKDITLSAWDKATIRDVYIKQDEVSKDLAQLNAKLEIETTHNLKVSIAIKIDSILTIEKIVELKKGINAIQIPITIENPKLWWTNGLGEQKLYNIQIDVKEGKNTIASNSKKIGVKTLNVIQKKDSVGESFYFELNGYPVFMKGANYIPQDVFLTRVSVKNYEQTIKNMVDANYNMIRVWGGGIYEKDIFYDLCDEYGILVWQDFMFACAMYPGNEGFLESVKKEAEYNVKRLRNHTSIALWCGNNENLVAWKNWGWIREIMDTQGQDGVDKVWKGYTDVFHEILPKAVERLDNDTFYWASSPTSARGENATLTSGDYHYWKVWGQQAPFSTFNEFIPRFMSEYGFQSFPEFSSVKKYTEQQDWNIYSNVMKSHQRSNIGNKNIELYMELLYNKPKDFQSFLYVSQLLQANGMQTAIEAHRRNMPYCMGSLYWQINDCWPVASWSSIDYYGNWKASHYKVKELYKPIKTIFFENKKQLEVHIVSDKLKDKSANLKLRVINFKGEILNSFESSFEIKANTSKIYFKENLNKIISDSKKANSIILAELSDENNLVFDESIFYFKTPNKLELTAPNIKFNVFRNDKGEIVVETETTNLAKDVCYTTSIAGRFSNNYFDMLPNKKYQIYFNSEEEISIDMFKENIKIKSLFDSY